MLRGFVDTAGFKAHIAELVNLEQSLVYLALNCKNLFNPAQIAPWDIAAVLLIFFIFHCL